MNNAKKAMLVLAAAGMTAGVSAGAAFADSGAAGASTNSPGVVSGNTAQVPLHVPANLTGNSVNVVGVLNSATGNASQAD